MSVHAQHHWYVPQLPEERLELAAELARENLDSNHSRIQKLVQEWLEPVYTRSVCSRCEELEENLADAEYDVRYLRAQVAELKYAQDASKRAHEAKETKR